MRSAAALLCAGLAAVACTASGDPSREDPVERSPASVSTTPATPAPTPAPAPSPTPGVRAADFEPQVAVDAVRHLAGRIGPREATSPSYDRAARWVARELSRSGLDVELQPVEVPAGVSWGVPVGAGRSVNVVATPPGLRPGEPHLLVGAHLDTVPQAPGAEDNASGVGVLLSVAGTLSARRARLPVVLVAFGAEEPRGGTDADHHYGSRQYVAGLTPSARAAVRGMVSLDRVGVGDVVPIGSAYDGPDPLADELAATARRIGVPVVREANRSSDHWQFAQAGIAGARLGSTPYAGYHSAQDVPAVVDPSQLDRVGRLVLGWLAP
jgi:aminopeptidase YwaD